MHKPGVACVCGHVPDNILTEVSVPGLALASCGNNHCASSIMKLSRVDCNPDWIKFPGHVQLGS